MNILDDAPQVIYFRLRWIRHWWPISMDATASLRHWHNAPDDGKMLELARKSFETIKQASNMHTFNRTTLSSCKYGWFVVLFLLYTSIKVYSSEHLLHGNDALENETLFIKGKWTNAVKTPLTLEPFFFILKNVDFKTIFSHQCAFAIESRNKYNI